MVSLTSIQELERLRRPGAWVLSVYLTVDPTRSTWPAPRTKVYNAVKGLEATAPTPAYRKALLREWERLDEWFAQWTPQGKGLVLFASEPLGLWRTWHLPVPVPDQVRFQESAYTTPLLDLLDEYERYAVVLVEKQRGRLFLVHLGQIEEENLVLTPVPQKHAQGGWSAPRFQRHHEEAVKEHVRAVAQALEEMARQRRFDRLILGGPVEARTALEEALPPTLRERVVGYLPLHPNDAMLQQKSAGGLPQDRGAGGAPARGGPGGRTHHRIGQEGFRRALPRAGTTGPAPAQGAPPGARPCLAYRGLSVHLLWASGPPHGGPLPPLRGHARAGAGPGGCRRGAGDGPGRGRGMGEGGSP